MKLILVSTLFVSILSFQVNAQEKGNYTPGNPALKDYHPKKVGQLPRSQDSVPVASAPIRTSNIVSNSGRSTSFSGLISCLDRFAQDGNQNSAESTVKVLNGSVAVIKSARNSNEFLIYSSNEAKSLDSSGTNPGQYIATEFSGTLLVGIKKRIDSYFYSFLQKIPNSNQSSLIQTARRLKSEVFFKYGANSANKVTEQEAKAVLRIVLANSRSNSLSADSSCQKEADFGRKTNLGRLKIF